MVRYTWFIYRDLSWAITFRTKQRFKLHRSTQNTVFGLLSGVLASFKVWEEPSNLLLITTALEGSSGRVWWGGSSHLLSAPCGVGQRVRTSTSAVIGDNATWQRARFRVKHLDAHLVRAGHRIHPRLVWPQSLAHSFIPHCSVKLPSHPAAPSVWGSRSLEMPWSAACSSAKCGLRVKRLCPNISFVKGARWLWTSLFSFPQKQWLGLVVSNRLSPLKLWLPNIPLCTWQRCSSQARAILSP